MSDAVAIERMRESTIRRAIGPTILLGSGTYFDFLDPENSEITIEDVAYGLAYEGRCAGQCYSRIFGRRAFYSVAQHCVLMSHAVEPALALSALCHEVGEAVCGDMTAPLKSLNPEFKAIEKRCEAAILKRLGVEIIDPVAIKRADVRMLATERRDLLPWKGERWTVEDCALPYDFEIIPWEPSVAAHAFLHRWNELQGGEASHG
ncbi:HD domain-containing protein [Sinorhizobium chiapasense]|uniref:HD domain-containing protein n=1 Tax=Sinorhizobium chiapasense TaxID=501572 RepID=A0ABZ2BD32_9HYPH